MRTLLPIDTRISQYVHVVVSLSPELDRAVLHIFPYVCLPTFFPFPPPSFLPFNRVSRPTDWRGFACGQVITVIDGPRYSPLRQPAPERWEGECISKSCAFSFLDRKFTSIAWQEAEMFRRGPTLIGITPPTSVVGDRRTNRQIRPDCLESTS